MNPRFRDHLDRSRNLLLRAKLFPFCFKVRDRELTFTEIESESRYVGSGGSQTR